MDSLFEKDFLLKEMMDESDIARLQDRGWLLSTFTIVSKWWVVFALILAYRLRKWNLEATIPFWKISFHLSIDQEIVFTIVHKDDTDFDYVFKIRVWRERHSYRCGPVLT